MNLVRIATWSEVPDGMPTAATAENVDLVIIRRGDEHSVLHGRCLHRGALLADGHIVGDDLICGLHGWDYRIESGVSVYNNAEALAKFASVVEDDGLFVDLDDVIRWKLMHPQPFSPDVYQGLSPRGLQRADRGEIEIGVAPSCINTSPARTARSRRLRRPRCQRRAPAGGAEGAVAVARPARPAICATSEAVELADWYRRTCGGGEGDVVDVEVEAHADGSVATR